MNLRLWGARRRGQRESIDSILSPTAEGRARRKAYRNRSSDFLITCKTPQARGTPTQSQAPRATIVSLFDDSLIVPPRGGGAAHRLVSRTDCRRIRSTEARP